TDRRHFSTSGSTGEDESPRPPEPSEAEARGVTPDGAASGDFVTFIMSLGAQAGMLLGGVSGQPPDLKGARWLISILEMLRDKTEGRRTAEQSGALEGLLYELRLAYVERSRERSRVDGA